MTFSLPDAFVEYGDVLDSPIGMAALTNDNIGGLDEGPFEVLVGLLFAPLRSAKNANKTLQ
jgi:hypothetical protein